MLAGMSKKYRPNVAAIIVHPDGRVLVCRRSDHPESWQFPQGGLDKGEDPIEALRREVAEEIALPAEAYEVTNSKGPYRYDFPKGPDRRGFHGQEQTYFLCRLEKGAEAQVRPACGCGEFTEARWVETGSFPFELVPPMKQAVYSQVMRDFFGVRAE
jgi:putative (di)nucleoside polyphosphate hydrolase